MKTITKSVYAGLISLICSVFFGVSYGIRFGNHSTLWFLFMIISLIGFTFSCLIFMSELDDLTPVGW